MAILAPRRPRKFLRRPSGDSKAKHGLLAHRKSKTVLPKIDVIRMGAPFCGPGPRGTQARVTIVPYSTYWAKWWEEYYSIQLPMRRKCKIKNSHNISHVGPLENKSFMFGTIQPLLSFLLLPWGGY